MLKNIHAHTHTHTHTRTTVMFTKLPKIVILFLICHCSLSNRRNALEDLMAFATGMQRPPPLGFDEHPVTTFRHPEWLSDENHATREFPVANTCALELSLPILPNYSMFSQRMKAAISAHSFLTCHRFLIYLFLFFLIPVTLS